MTKILIVDDDPQVTSLFEKYLISAGYKPTVINDSSQAVKTALAIKPDLFIIDLMMPEPDGFKICRELRTYPKFLHTPILIVTALDDKDSRVVAFGAGADDYLTKPFHIEELARRITDLLDRD